MEEEPGSTLYISGMGSVYKLWITVRLQQFFGQHCVYYVLKNTFSLDCAHLDQMIADLPAPVRLIGHSTGGFHGLRLSHANDKRVASLHLINPAINLLDIVANYPLAAPFLVEKEMIDAAFNRFDQRVVGTNHPKFIYQGVRDAIVFPAYNRKKAGDYGATYLPLDLGHRFDESAFVQLLILIDLQAQSGLYGKHKKA
jgi:pimeloyl-ACP methyl ester carboxylesterase